MDKLFNDEQQFSFKLLHALAWVVQYGFWLAVFAILFVLTFLNSFDIQQFRYVGF